MSSSNDDINPRSMRDNSEEEMLQANVTHQRPHHLHRQGGGATPRLIAEVTQMAASMRDIATKNMAMRKLLMQAQGHQGLQMPKRSHTA